MTEIKPCPFCGSNDITVDTFKVKNDRWQSGVVCSSCLGGIDTLNTYLTPEESKALAIEAWNKRAEPSRPRGHWEMVSQHETPPTYAYSCSE